MAQHEQDLKKVQDALDWAFRSSYTDGQAAGEAFARLMGLKLTIEDGGLYADRLRFEGQAHDPVAMRHALQCVWGSGKLSKSIALGNLDHAGEKIGPYAEDLTEAVYQALNP